MKKLLIVIISLIVICIAGFLFLRGKTTEIVITEKQIEEKLADKFPYEKTYLLVLKLTYNNPQFDLLEEQNKIRVGMDTMLNLKLGEESEPLNGGITVLCDLIYDKDEQAFYLNNAELERLDISGIPEKWEEKVKKYAPLAVNAYFENHPVYELKGRNTKESIAKALLKDVVIKEEGIHVSLGL